MGKMLHTVERDNGNKETHVVDRIPNMELEDKNVLREFSSSNQEKIEMNRNEAVDSDSVNTFFREDFLS